jgi:adenosylcobinamide-phosphate synthase
VASDLSFGALAPAPALLAAAVVLDLCLGDPVYPWHPARLTGRALLVFERVLRSIGLDGRVGGVWLFALLALTGGGVATLLILASSEVNAWLGFGVHLFVVYTGLALGDLLRHVWRIESAVRSGDLVRARAGVGMLVGRDTDVLDAAGCRRAAVESLSENLTDGFVSPVFWYVAGGPLGLVMFKIASTMDSMVGNKTPRYLHFGWFGARLDDVMNYLPARATWLTIAVVAALAPGLSGRKAWRVGLEQHSTLPGPNSGWSEAAAAGALQRRLVGPIWLGGCQVTDAWIGVATDPPLGSAGDVARALDLVAVSGVLLAGLGCAVLWSI